MLFVFLIPRILFFDICFKFFVIRKTLILTKSRNYQFFCPFQRIFFLNLIRRVKTKFMISSSLDTFICYINTPWNFAGNNSTRSSPPEVFLSKGNLKIYRKFTGEHPSQSVISVKLLCTSVWVPFCKFAACFQNMFSSEHLWTAVSGEFFNIRVLHIPSSLCGKAHGVLLL